MSSSEFEAIVARLDKIESSLVRLDKIEDSLIQLQLTTAKLEGTNETIQKMLGGAGSLWGYWRPRACCGSFYLSLRVEPAAGGSHTPFTLTATLYVRNTGLVTGGHQGCSEPADSEHEPAGTAY